MCNCVERKIYMAVSYKKLWKLLIDKDMKKKDLQATTGLSRHMMLKLSRNESVTTDVLATICRKLDCNIEDIMEVVPEE